MTKIKIKELYKSTKIKSKIEKKNIVVSNYDQLIKELKSHNISAQEAFNLAYKNKYQFNARYHWTMARIGMYLKTRYFQYMTSFLEELYQQYILKQNPSWVDLGGLSLKKFKYKYIKHDANLLKDIPQKQKKIIGRHALSNMSKKIDSCRKTVNSEDFIIQFKKFNPKAKFEARKEVQNLHKLVTEKRHRKKFYEREWDIIHDDSVVQRGFQQSIKLDGKSVEKLR